MSMDLLHSSSEDVAVPAWITSISAALAEPRAGQPLGTWVGHMPFAYWLVDQLKPRTIVELGVFRGGSYCTFCQAVEQSLLDTRCYGVDTFNGDLHAGFYESTVLQELRAFHDPLYGSFSELIPSEFSDALDRFENGSVDLLHIDGLHFYESVKADFETWLPKMSDRGIVLFHDTQVFHNDFGVYKFWAELQERYPSFEFYQSFGLGVLAVGTKIPSAVFQTLFASEENLGDVRRFFEFLGSRLALQAEAAATNNFKEEIQNLNLKKHQLENQQALAQKCFIELAEKFARVQKESLALGKERDELLKERQVQALPSNGETAASTSNSTLPFASLFRLLKNDKGLSQNQAVKLATLTEQRDKAVQQRDSHREKSAALQSRLSFLEPLAMAGWKKFSTQEAYLEDQQRGQLEYQARRAYEEGLWGGREQFTVPARCGVCKTDAVFHIESAAAGSAGPAWREQLRCQTCHLNALLRAALQFFTVVAPPSSRPKVYVTEQVTALYHHVHNLYPDAKGSECLTDGTGRGEYSAGGLRHEELTALTFQDESFDAVLSFETLSNVTSRRGALRELARVLKPGGLLWATFPFDPEVQVTTKHVFGWDIMDVMRSVGLVHLDLYSVWNPNLGLLGSSLYFMAGRKAE